MEKSGNPKPGRSNRGLVLSFIVGVVCLSGYLIADWYRTVPDDQERFFVGRESCVECHQEQAALFHGSHHDMAMDFATSETVLASFDGQTIEHFGVVSRVFKDGNRFMVHTEGPDGEMRDYEVKYVFGVTPLQQYMVELDPPTKVTRVSLESSDLVSEPVGRVQVLRLSWDTINERWFYLLPPDVNERIEPGDPLHWTGITQSWNASCAECHSTNLKKNFDPLLRKYGTTFSEIDVSCEACHGPGSLHVELANRKSLFWDRNQGYGLLKLKSTTNLPQINTCAPCHSRRTETGGQSAGCNFDDHYACQLITEPVYHADGQIRDEDYVYGSFIQSKMFHNGIKCTDCHDPHSAKVKFPDNRLCTSCHQHPAGKYDTVNHHHHSDGGKGTLCVECHMPATTYMAVDARRDHSFRVPRPDISVKLGTPNACTGCHLQKANVAGNTDSRLDQYLDWIIARESDDAVVMQELNRVDKQMAEAFEKWYPKDRAMARTNYYERIAIGKSENGLPTLIEMATDRSVPAIFRASAVADLAADDSELSLDAARLALEDPDPKVVSAALQRFDREIGRISDRLRYEANQNLRVFQKVVEQVAPLVMHDSRRVRMEAARVLVSVPPDARNRYTESEARRAFDSAFSEYRKSLLALNDRAMTHTMLAGLYELSGNINKAVDAYRTSIVIEPNLAGPRGNLAAILEAEAAQWESQIRPTPGNVTDAGQLQEAMQRIRKLRSEAGQLRMADHELLKTDIQRSEGLTETHGLHFRYAMSSFLQRDLETTEKHLKEAFRQAPKVPMYLLGLSTYYQEVNQPEEAAKFVERLLEIDPDHPGYRSLAAAIAGQLEMKNNRGGSTNSN